MTSQDSLLHRVAAYCAKHELISDNSTIILGLSGGPDSIFLLHALAPLHHNGTISLVAAHLDHEWRATSSNDALFCQTACDALGIPLVVQKMSQLSSQPKFNGSLEDLGRTVRRHFFETVCAQHNGSAIALGHHAQDQQETFFIRLIRGSSLSGLVGMQPKNGLYIRPLLELNKSDIVAYLDAHHIAYVTDESNASDMFLRNRIRNNVLPALNACDNRFDQNFFATLERLQKAERLLEDITSKTLADISEMRNERCVLDKNKLCVLTDALQDRVIMAWLIRNGVQFPLHEGFLKEIKKFIAQPGSATHAMYATWNLKRTSHFLFIDKK